MGPLLPALLLLAPLLMGATYTRLDVSWPLSAEPDLYAYVIHWGTESGSYSLPEVTVLKRDCAASTCANPFFSLEPAHSYFFALTAIDEAGNESGLSPEASALPRVVSCVPPAVTEAEDILTSTPYLPLCFQRQVRVLGSNFSRGASVSFPTSSITGTTLAQYVDSSQLELGARVGGATPLGLTDVEVTNADTCSGLLSDSDLALRNSLEVVRSPDFDGDSLVGGKDLNLLAIAFGSVVGGSKYSLNLDMNGDGRINGDDLARFGPFLASTVTSCP